MNKLQKFVAKIFNIETDVVNNNVYWNGARRCEDYGVVNIDRVERILKAQVNSGDYAEAKVGIARDASVTRFTPLDSKLKSTLYKTTIVIELEEKEWGDE